MASIQRSETQTREAPAQLRRGSPYWLIVRRGSSSLEGFYVMELSDGDGALPIFSLEDEARLFQGYCGYDWEIREVPAKDLISLLMGKGRGISRVALDPVAGMDPGPVVTGWGVFLDSLLGRDRHWFESRNGYGNESRRGYSL